MSQLYPQGAAHILGKATKVDFVADSFKFLFYSGSFVGTHEFVSDLTSGSIIARSATMTGVTVTSGVVDANDAVVPTVSGAAFTHIIIYKDTGSDATSVLVAIMDFATFTPTGANISVVWSSSGLFSIA